MRAHARNAGRALPAGQAGFRSAIYPPLICRLTAPYNTCAACEIGCR